MPWRPDSIRMTSTNTKEARRTVDAPLPIGVLLSGNGSNLQAIIEAIDRGWVNADIRIVISSRTKAYGLTRAERAGLPTFSMTPQMYRDDPIAADELIARKLREAGCEYVIMAGYMRMVRKPILDAFPNRVINLHPALLPSFPGAHAIEEAYDAGVKVTGVTVHFANEVYDDGSIIAQVPIPVQQDWDQDDLENAIHKVEHKLYPEVVKMLSEGRVTVRPDGKVDIALQKHGRAQTLDFSERLHEYLFEHDGYCPFTDKSDAEAIYREFHVSKKVFKRAVGDLYKRRLITLAPDGIELKTMNVFPTPDE